MVLAAAYARLAFAGVADVSLDFGVVRREAHLFELVFDAAARFILRSIKWNLDSLGRSLLYVAHEPLHAGRVDLDTSHVHAFR